MKSLQKGEVLVKVSDHGKTVISTEMLLLPQTKLALNYSEDKDTIKLVISDSSLDIPDLSGELDLSTLEDYIKALKKMYLQLRDKQ
jgi:hypothetical protein